MTTDDGRAVHLAAIVVRYKKPLGDIPALDLWKSAPGAGSAELLVVDNSPTAVPQTELDGLPKNVRYRWMGGNVGLSKAYNTGIAMLEGAWTHLCFLDQDTRGITALFEDFRGGLRAGVTLPVVRASGTIISPCRRTGPWYRPIESAGSVPANISWINSGMTIERAIVERVRFDEALFLDYVDHRFAASALAAGATVDVRWAVTLSQDYSRATDDVEQAQTRFGIFLSDVTTFYDGRPGGRLWAAVLTLRRALGAARSYRSSSFIRQWITGRRADGAQG